MGNTLCSTEGRGNCNFSNLMIINKYYAQDIIKNSLLHSKLVCVTYFKNRVFKRFISIKYT
jgi:hypothetical protein